ncbi:MAG: discoidin domain-containing protein [Pseudomonadota bacterium]
MKIDNKKSLFFLLILVLLTIFSRLMVLITPNLFTDEGVISTMSLRVMHGEFPIFFYGQQFMGSLETYLTAVLFHCFGPSLFTLTLLPVMLSLLFLYLIFFLAKRMLGSQVALISGFLLAIPSSDLMRWSYEARSHYPLTLVFGTLLFILVLKIVSSEASKGKKTLLFGLMGVVAGLGWWTNYLIMVYFIPAAFFLFLYNKKLLFSRNFILLSLLFLSGSLPLWIFNLFHYYSLSGIYNWGTFSDIPVHLKGLFSGGFPILLGLRTPSFDPKGLVWAIPIFSNTMDYGWVFFLGGIYTISLTSFLIKNRKGIQSIILKFRLKSSSGNELLLFLFFVNIVIILLTRYGAQAGDDSRYLLPLYTCLPIFLAAFLVDIGKRSRVTAVLFLLIVLSFNVYQNIRHNRWIFFNSANYISYQENKKEEGRLLAFLTKNGFNRIFLNHELDHLGKKLILFSQEALLCSNPYEEGYLRYANLVDGANKVSYLFQGENHLFEENLNALGGSYRKIKAPGGYILYTDYRPPAGNYRLISRDLWKGKSVPSSADTSLAFDGDVASGWTTLQEPGTSMTIDLGRMEIINKVSFIPGSYREIPAGYQIDISPDGRIWKTVTKVSQYLGPFFWSGPNPLIKIRQGRIETAFSPDTGRFIRILLIGKRDGFNWSINEINVYGPGQSRASVSYLETDTDNLVKFLKSQKINFAYADHWLSAVIRIRSNRAIGTITSNHYLNDYGERELPPDSFPKVNFTTKTAFILEEENRKAFEDILAESEYSYQIKKIGLFSVYYDCSCSPLPVQSFLGLKISSNVNDKDTGLAVDHDLSTRWTSLKPQNPGMIVNVDLGDIKRVKGFVLWSGKALSDYARDLRVMGSCTGVTWKEIKTRWASDFYWSGTQLIKMRGEKISYLFSPTDLRYLKLIQEGKSDSNYWSIYELGIVGSFD